MKQKYSKYPAVLKMCVAAIVAITGGSAVAGMVEGQAAAAASLPSYTKHTDRLIIKYKDVAVNSKAATVVPAIAANRLATAQSVGKQRGVTMKMSHATATGAHVLKFDKNLSVDEVRAMAAELKSKDASIEYAEPDRRMAPMFTPNDSRYGEQWHYFENTGGLRLPTAWDISTGSGAKVAVLDTGYRPHSDLAANIVGGYDFIGDTFVSNDGNGRDSDASDPGDAVNAGECGNGEPAQRQNSSWHGTHVAGTIAAVSNNSSGVAGVAFGAKVVPVRVLGKCGGYTSDIADAIIWASGGSVSGVPANANPAKVINMSLGGGGACDTTTQNAINSARSRGTAVVVAAGNENMDASNSNPANCSGVITVAATNRSGGRAWYSNYGSVVDVAAPGGDTSVSSNGILSTLNAGTGAPGADSYAFYQGTSMATPHVAGVAALMMSKDPTMTPDAVESKLKSSARAFPATCSGCGAGIVDATAALSTDTWFQMNETESNGSLSTANSVTNRKTQVNANMGNTTDIDYFKLSLPGGATLTAALAPNASSDYDLYVYNSNGTLIGSSENGTGATDTVTVTNTSSYTYTRYVKVVYYSGGTGSTSGKYSLKLSW